MKLIVGLGNPGAKFQRDRHNIGFQTVERFAERHGFRFNEKRAKAQIAHGQIGGEAVILAKPQTFMNLSGESVRPLLKGSGAKLEDLLVVSDEIDLPLGRLRLRASGSHGGHNGLRSIIGALGTNEFARLRIGVGRPARGDSRAEVTSHVLGTFGRDDEPVAELMRDRGAEAIAVFIEDGIVEAMNRFNGLEVPS
jgi:PTH1 family peptidyl-tRNA hydrolase